MSLVKLSPKPQVPPLVKEVNWEKGQENRKTIRKRISKPQPKEKTD